MINHKSDMRIEPRPNLKGGKGTIDMLHLLEKEDSCGKCNICGILTINPGDSIGLHPHGPDAEIYYVLEGELEVTDNGRADILHTGDAMYTSGGDTHSVENKSPHPARLLAVVIV